MFHPRLFGKPNGDAISVQLRKCFTHVTRGCQGSERRESRAGRRGNLSHVADKVPDTASASEGYPGQRLGLPPEGRGSLASWRARIGALIIDWAACMAIAVGFFGTAVLTGSGWRSWMILTVFFVESALLSWLAGGSFAHGRGGIMNTRLLVRIGPRRGLRVAGHRWPRCCRRWSPMARR